MAAAEKLMSPEARQAPGEGRDASSGADSDGAAAGVGPRAVQAVVRAVAAGGGNLSRERQFSERLTELMNRYVNSQFTAAGVIEELIKVSREIAEEARRGERFDLLPEGVLRRRVTEENRLDTSGVSGASTGDAREERDG